MPMASDLAEMCVITTLGSVGDCASASLYLKQTEAYKTGDSRFVEEQKRTASIFIQTLEGLSKMEQGLWPKDYVTIPFYAGLNSYLKDKKHEVLELFSKVRRAMEQDENVSEALKGLVWYENLVQERTSDKRRHLDRTLFATTFH
jgi:hypothetical protein